MPPTAQKKIENPRKKIEKSVCARARAREERERERARSASARARECVLTYWHIHTCGWSIHTCVWPAHQSKAVVAAVWHWHTHTKPLILRRRRIFSEERHWLFVSFLDWFASRLWIDVLEKDVLFRKFLGTSEERWLLSKEDNFILYGKRWKKMSFGVFAYNSKNRQWFFGGACFRPFWCTAASGESPPPPCAQNYCTWMVLVHAHMRIHHRTY